MARTFFGSLVGAMVVGLVLAASGYCISEIYRLPTAADFALQESIADYLAAAPGLAIACALSGLALSAFLGSWVAAIIAKPHREGAALLIGGALTVLVIVAASLVPIPASLVVVAMLLPIPFAVPAALLAIPRNGY